MTDEDPTTEDLLEEQADIEEVERRRAERTASDDEELKATRRADKAAYLREKLEDQVANPDEEP